MYFEHNIRKLKNNSSRILVLKSVLFSPKNTFLWPNGRTTFNQKIRTKMLFTEWKVIFCCHHTSKSSKSADKWHLHAKK